MKPLIAAAAFAAAAACAAQKPTAKKPAPPPAPENVPELMTASSGAKIETAAAWESVRAPELLSLFAREEYGVRPAAAEDRSRTGFAVVDEREAMGGAAVRKIVEITYKGPCGELKFRATAFIPKAPRKVPAFLLICNRDPKENIDPDRAAKSGFWPAEEIVARGYAAIAFWNGDIAPDDRKARFRKGVFPCVEAASARKADSWAAISAWAWGASRVMDWIETEPLIDGAHVAVAGHSRGGKTALWAGATDRRFAMVCSNNSGCGGMKLNHIRLPRSESIAKITQSFPHWFCRNFSKYRGKERTMPFDQHQLAALIAPRLLAVAVATEDHWSGQAGQWHACRLAGPAWELYGKKGLAADEPPAPGAARQEGCISYHVRQGVHDLTPHDWERYLDFADLHGWRGKQTTRKRREPPRAAGRMKKGD